MAKLEKGCIQIYTGEGKGKTTAALGLALRAAGHGMRTFIGQFMKGSEYGELDAVKKLDGLVTIEQFGGPSCIPLKDTPDPVEVERAERGLEECRQALVSGRYDIVVCDEIFAALRFKLITLEDVLSLMDARPSGIELVLTGRWAPEPVVARADLVTEMREIKHHFRDGVKARDGIER